MGGCGHGGKFRSKNHSDQQLSQSLCKRNITLLISNLIAQERPWFASVWVKVDSLLFWIFKPLLPSCCHPWWSKGVVREMERGLAANKRIWGRGRRYMYEGTCLRVKDKRDHIPEEQMKLYLSSFVLWICQLTDTLCFVYYIKILHKYAILKSLSILPFLVQIRSFLSSCLSSILFTLSSSPL